jgi:hypothetical protein
MGFKSTWYVAILGSQRSSGELYSEIEIRLLCFWLEQSCEWRFLAVYSSALDVHKIVPTFIPRDFTLALINDDLHGGDTLSDGRAGDCSGRSGRPNAISYLVRRCCLGNEPDDVAPALHQLGTKSALALGIP